MKRFSIRLSARRYRSILIGLLSAFLLSGCGPRPAGPGIFYDFESEDELDRVGWSCRTRYEWSDMHATSGTRSLHCLFGKLKYPGLMFRDFPTDLSRVEAMSFDVWNATSDTINLVVRIDDDLSGANVSNRYNGSFHLIPGENVVEVLMDDVRAAPATREMNLSRIKQFLIFLIKRDERTDLYFDRFEFR